MEKELAAAFAASRQAVIAIQRAVKRFFVFFMSFIKNTLLSLSELHIL